MIAIRPKLRLLDLRVEGPDSLAIVQATTPEERFFPPLLAAQLLIEVRGLVHQSCFSRPASPGAPPGARRWAFAQEIFSNNGRGTEAGHFLEHLALEMLTTLHRQGRPRRFSAETSWDFRQAPELFRISFFRTPLPLVLEALSRSAEILARHHYGFELLSPPLLVQQA